MKKSGFLLLFIMIAFSTCGGGSSSGGGGNSGGGESSSVIDISNTSNCIYPNAFSFGYKSNDQAKRFQTFIADCHTKLDGIEVKIRKNNGSQIYKNVSVELYETKGNFPATKVAETTIDNTSLKTESTVTRAELKYQMLVPGMEYAIVLGQVNLDGTNDGFEWCTSEVNSKLNFGKLEGSTWTDESGLGDGWLKLYVSGGVCSSATSYYTGVIMVEVKGQATMGTCTTTYNDIGFFNILLENDPSFPSDGLEYKNSQAVTITGGLDETSSACTPLKYLNSGGARILTPSASAFPVTLFVWDPVKYNKYELVVSTIAFPDCNSNLGLFPGMISGCDVQVSPLPADISHLVGEKTVIGPSNESIKVTWNLTRYD